jgi:hypothetical protein
MPRARLGPRWRSGIKGSPPQHRCISKCVFRRTRARVPIQLERPFRRKRAQIDTLLTAYEKEGVRWIDLPSALADPFYAERPNAATKAGAAFPYPIAKSKGVQYLPYPERPAEEALKQTCR